MKDRQLPIWEQLLKSADTAEKSVLSQQRRTQEKSTPGQKELFEHIRVFSHALERLSERDRASENMEKRILLRALTELGEMANAVLNEMNQGRFITCLILMRPMQELAYTLTFAAKEKKLIEWYEYSIEKDIRDINTQKSILKQGISGKWPRSTPEQAEYVKECTNSHDARIQELKNLKTALGTHGSGKEWRDLRKMWEPNSEEFARRMQHANDMPLDDIHKDSWVLLNAYIHARSREFSPPPTLDSALNQLLMTWIHINQAGQKSLEMGLL